MKLLKLYVLTFLCSYLIACGDEDNAEPPAELVSFQATAELELNWSSETFSGVEQQYLQIEPLVLDDRIVTSGRDGVVYSVNAVDGDVLQEFDTTTSVSGGVGGNDSVWLLTSTSGELIAVDGEKGDVIWRLNMPSEALSRPVVYKDIAFVRTVDGQTLSIDLVKGDIRWSYKQTEPSLTLRGSSSPVISRDKLFVGLPNGRLVALSHNDGSVLWDIALAVPQGHSEIQRLTDIDGHAELYGFVLYAASYQGRVAAIDTQQGRILWARDFSSYTGVTVDDKTLYSSDENSHIWALDRYNGATLWKQDKLQARQVTRPLLTGDYVIVGDYDGYLHVLSRFDGHFVARVQVGDDENDDIGENGIVITPTLVDDNIIVTTRNGRLHSYSLSKLTSTE